MGSGLTLARRGAISAGTVASSFDPFALSNLVVGLEADQLSLSDTDPVATWTNPGSGPDFTQATGSARPTFRTAQVNGHPVVRFDGGDTLTAVLGADQSQPTTLVAVCKLASTATNMDVLAGSDGSALTSHVLRHLGTGSWRLNAGSNADRAVANDTNWHLFICAINGASTVYGVDGSETTVNVGARGVRTLNLGSSGSASNYLNGDIAALFLYGDAKNGTDRGELKTHFATKYGISVS